MQAESNDESDPLLAAELFQTRDIEQARQWGVRTFCENELRHIDVRSELNARLLYRKYGSIGIGRMTYGGEVTIRPDTFDDFYLVQVPLSGGERITHGNETINSSPTVGSVLNARQQHEINHRTGTEKLILRIDRDLVERLCGQLLGNGAQTKVEFETAMPLDSESGRRWASTMQWLFDYLGGTQSPSPLLTAQIEHMIGSLLLISQASNHSSALNEDRSRSITPSFIRKAELFIEERAHESITVGSIAEHVGVSTSSLYTGFRKYRNTSPMHLLKSIRLNRVREQLLKSDAKNTTVTAVAYQWGFSHLGHFTTDYKRWFGESPGETLAR
ncbi:AraC family transcriptional regulator [Paraburkholderia dinghuensis]|uniref:AraC family transcriptional regulator n=1 Tax=Paraburkholderia dinghuensis TaxID=2305225 RepID=A0A3N6PVX2_9BURK|nr:AraC family transcriptional regulator [Paraburkholderia dinghuensis]RQH06410.1 AraC family transcriptional regulator [Paraburkholderia dinghuensis]